MAMGLLEICSGIVLLFACFKGAHVEGRVMDGTKSSNPIMTNQTNILTMTSNTLYSCKERAMCHSHRPNFTGLVVDCLNLNVNSVKGIHPNNDVVQLASNRMCSISTDILDRKGLKYLDLSSNTINTIKPTGLLSGNNRTTYLEYIGIATLRSYSSIIFLSDINETLFTSVDQSKWETPKPCDIDNSKITMLVSWIMFFISVVICCIVYRYRWKLRFLFYMAKTMNRRHTQIINAEDDDEYKYDAFILYCSENDQFVQEMSLQLEDNCRLHLCIPERDFIPGVRLTQSITNAIHLSRKVVVLLSRSYLDSYECMEEFDMARMESIYVRGGDSVLFLVFYEDIPAKDLPLQMLGLIESNSYMEYPQNDVQGKVAFWDKLATNISK